MASYPKKQKCIKCVKKCKVKCCKNKLLKLSNDILSTGLVASQCEIDRYYENIAKTEYKFNSVLNDVMQQSEHSDPLDSEIKSYSAQVMTNCVWTNLYTFKMSDPTLQNYIWILQCSPNDLYNYNVMNFNIISHDILKCLLNIQGIDQGTTRLPIGEITKNSDDLYSNTVVTYVELFAKEIIEILLGDKPVTLPMNDDTNNQVPIVSNSVYNSKDNNGNDVINTGKIAIWREKNSDDNVNFYIMGYGSNMCKNPVSSY
jgi:hypothetical protein